MTGAAIIRYMCEIRGISIKELSGLMNCPSQSLRNKLYRDTFPFKEIEHIADLLGFDIVAVMRDIQNED